VTPPTVITRYPVVAELGTVTVTLVVPQLVTEAETPLNDTVLDPCVEPKLLPEIVTELLMPAEDGERDEIVGGVVVPASGEATAKKVEGPL